MSRTAAKLAAIRKRLPSGRRLPRELTAFAKLVVSERGPRHDRMELTWSDPRPLLNAGRSALESLLPFLRLGDGGVIALWWRSAEPNVVFCDSEGQFAVIAVSFRDFLTRFAHPTPDFAERLEIDAPIDTSSLLPTSRPKRIPAALSNAFSAWVESQSLSAKPDASASANQLAKKLQAITRRMLQDGLSKVYKLRDFHWSMEFCVEHESTTWKVTYLDYGKWIALPTRYDLVALLPDLTRLMKNPRSRRFQLSVWKDGHVFIDRGNQLTIEPRS